MFPTKKTAAFMVFVLALAGCTSGKEPFARQYERPSEQCLTNAEFRASGTDGIESTSRLASSVSAFRADAPRQYVVRKGDTLWDISGRFLHKPWYWRQIWYSNPQIKNPDLIYPGDVLSIVTVAGQPHLAITEARNHYHGTATGRYTESGLPIVSYDPEMNDPARPGAESIMAQSVLGPFLMNMRIVGTEALPTLPFVFGSGEQYLTLSQQDVIYAKGRQGERGENLWIYRPGEPVLDYDAESSKQSGKAKLLGQQMRYIGEATVLDYDPGRDLTSLQPMSAVQAIQEGDVLMMPDIDIAPVNYFPRLPSKQCNRGYMLNSMDNYSLNIKEYDPVVTSFGLDNGARVGDVWAIERPGQDRVINGQIVSVPGEQIGFLMIYKVYDQVSLAVILDSSRPIAATDYLVHP